MTSLFYEKPRIYKWNNFFTSSLHLCQIKQIIKINVLQCEFALFSQGWSLCPIFVFKVWMNWIVCLYTLKQSKWQLVFCFTSSVFYVCLRNPPLCEHLMCTFVNYETMYIPLGFIYKTIYVFFMLTLSLSWYWFAFSLLFLWIIFKRKAYHRRNKEFVVLFWTLF